MKYIKWKLISLFFLLGSIFYIYGLFSYKYNLFPYYPLKPLASNLINTDDNSNTAYSKIYLLKKSFFDENGSISDVVMIGDSITMGAEWSELFTDISIANRAISGDTTVGVLNRMDSIFSTQAKKAFIMLGFNDLANNKSVDLVFSNYKKIIELLVAHNIKPYIQSTLYVSGNRSFHNKKIVELNIRLKNLAKNNGFIYIDLNKSLSKDGELIQLYTIDDLHLNGKGYVVWKEKIKKFIYK